MDRSQYLHNKIMLNALSFKSNFYKTIVRSDLAKKLEVIVNEKQSLLHYFGMPAANFYDMNTFKSYINKLTSVEYNEVIFNEQLEKVKNFDLIYKNMLFGDIDLIIKSGEDENHKKIVWPFDFIFLDYYDCFELNRLEIFEKCMFEQKENGVDSWIFALCHKFEFHNTNEKEILLENHQSIIRSILDVCKNSGYFHSDMDTFIYIREGRKTKELQTYMQYSMILKDEKSSRNNAIKIHFSNGTNFENIKELVL
ncbi:hypothetical protein ACFSR7_01880 [Cohnella sp. GCM10020058]|uniref:hypothetical protein n=1 Tax=Cohnella sp. GCM10020058 TaxID=3317330 RepID=UPI003635C964